MSESTRKSSTRGVFELPRGQASCEAPHGSLLTAAAEAAGVMLNVACGGTGACGGCPMSQMTLKMGIEKVVKQAVPEIQSVEAGQ